MSEQKELYFCDPAANTECGHRYKDCALLCGSCYATDKREFALPGPDGTPEVVTPKKAAEMRALHGQAWSAEALHQLQKRFSSESHDDAHACDRNDAIRYALLRKAIRIPDLVAMSHEEHVRRCELSALGNRWHNELRHLENYIPPKSEQTQVTLLDPETAKIRKHNHDTLWAVLAGFAACAVLLVVGGLIVIGILSFVWGR